MIYKMSRNAHKGRWDETTLERALELLKGEVSELDEAVKGGNMVEILLEAADVANFSMIAAAIAIERSK